MSLIKKRHSAKNGRYAVAQRRVGELLYHHCQSFMECLMQNIENDLQERSYDAEDIEWWFEDKGLPEDVVQAAIAYAQENGRELGASVFEELHDEVWAKTEEEKDKWVTKWNAAAQQYLAGRTDLTPEQREEAEEYLSDEEDTIFWAAWGEAGSGVGHYDAPERSPWSNELLEMNIDGDDILKLMPSGFTLHEAVDNEAFIIEDLMVEKALQAVQGNSLQVQQANNASTKMYVGMRLKTQQYDDMVKDWIHEISPTPPHVGKVILDTIIAWDAPVEEWLEKAEHEGLFPPDDLRHPTTNTFTVKVWVTKALNHENAASINYESEITKVGGRFGYSERDGYLAMHFGYSNSEEGLALVEEFGNPAHLQAVRGNHTGTMRRRTHMKKVALSNEEAYEAIWQTSGLMLATTKTIIDYIRALAKESNPDNFYFDPDYPEDDPNYEEVLVGVAVAKEDLDHALETIQKTLKEHLR